MKNSALLVAVVIASSCSIERETTYLTPPAITAPSPTADPFPAPQPPAAMAVISGPMGCFEMATQPDVLTWVIHNVPLGAKIDRAYAHDGDVNCDLTVKNLRTENDHLRWRRDGTTVTVWFDKATYDCGRAQIDLTIDGATPIGVIGKYGRNCPPEQPTPPRPSPPPVPPIPPPAPPPLPPPQPPPAGPPPCVSCACDKTLCPPPPPPPCAACECDKKFCPAPPPPPPPKPCPTSGDSSCPPPPPKPCPKGGDDKPCGGK